MAKISDFGISKILVGDSTCASMTIGNLVTHVWTAPESIVSKICVG